MRVKYIKRKKWILANTRNRLSHNHLETINVLRFVRWDCEEYCQTIRSMAACVVCLKAGKTFTHFALFLL